MNSLERSTFLSFFAGWGGYVHNRYVGYCQYYNTLNFFKSSFLNKSGHTYAGFGIFLGEEEVLRRGVAFNTFVENTSPSSFEYLLVDPERENMTTRKIYERNGFSYFQHEDLKEVLWMIRARTKT